MKLIELDIVNFGRQIFDLTGASIQTSYKLRDSGYSLFLSDGTQLPLNESYDSLRQRLMEAGMLVGLPRETAKPAEHWALHDAKGKEVADE
jgi:hypothetical protein